MKPELVKVLPQSMTTDEALDTLAQVTDKYLGTKGDHIMLQLAYKTLRNALEIKPNKALN